MIVHAVRWDSYQRLNAKVPGARFAYDRGRLEVRRITAAIERPNRTMCEIVDNACDIMGIDYCPLGSTTFRREDLLKGFEPDSCFYLTHAAQVRDKNEIDLAIDPPPELVIEIDITSGSLHKLPIFAAVGVAEVGAIGEAR